MIDFSDSFYRMSLLHNHNLILGGLILAIKKSELYSHLWKICDELRGGMDDHNTRIMCLYYCL